MHDICGPQMDVFEFCKSRQFLAGGKVELEKKCDFFDGQVWVRRVTDVNQYLSAIATDPDGGSQVTAWRILKEEYLDYFLGLTGRVFSLGTGEHLKQVRASMMALSELLATDRWTRPLAESIGKITEVDANRLLQESLVDAQYGNLRAIYLSQELLPNVVFPVLALMREAYLEGLYPYGVYDHRISNNYSDPPALLCINPTRLL